MERRCVQKLDTFLDVLLFILCVGIMTLMIFTPKIRQAIRFSIKIHELDQKQKRKNKDVAYITHPLTVGLILAKAGADEDTIIAGILHDTIEDSAPEKKVTREILKDMFDENVAVLVESASEHTEQSWEDRKAADALRESPPIRTNHYS